MCNYKGNKKRYASKIITAITADLASNNIDITDDTYFVDLFCGGGNMVENVSFKNRIANDINPYVISYLRRIQEEGADWLLEPFYWNITPEIYNIFREDYKKETGRFSQACLGHVGCNFSYGSNFFGGYNNTEKETPYSFAKRAYTKACKEHELLQGVRLLNMDFRQVYIPKGSIVYCDIPYEGTSNYGNKFSTKEFLEHAKYLTEQGNYVYYSEYNAPLPEAYVEGIIIDEILNYNVPKLFGNGVKSSNHIGNRNSTMKEVA
jgi:DNA adenine methylase